jgi:hypothetical protein
VVDSKFPEIIQLFDDLDSIPYVCRISIDHLDAYSRSLFKSCGLLFAECERKTMSDFSVAYVKKMHAKLVFVVKQVEKAFSSFQDCITYFGDDPKELTAEQWFGGIQTFLVSFKSAIDQKKKAKESLSKSYSSSLLNTRSSSPANSETSSLQPKLPDITEGIIVFLFCLSIAAGDQKGVMDHLLESLRKGNVPRVKT